MEEYKKTKLYKAIDEVLHYIWDPIGVAGVPDARDEYYHYNYEVYKLVVENADEKTIAEYLLRTEKDSMGLELNNMSQCLEIASIINEWNILIKKTPLEKS